MEIEKIIRILSDVGAKSNRLAFTIRKYKLFIIRIISFVYWIKTKTIYSKLSKRLKKSRTQRICGNGIPESNIPDQIREQKYGQHEANFATPINWLKTYLSRERKASKLYSYHLTKMTYWYVLCSASMPFIIVFCQVFLYFSIFIIISGLSFISEKPHVISLISILQMSVGLNDAKMTSTDDTFT